jgi:hypothetical protein
MKSISKLALVVLLLAASYKMYGQNTGCSSQPFLNCMNGCETALANCQSDCGGEGSSDWADCMHECNFDMCNCAWSCGAIYGCDTTNCNNG